MRTLILLAIAAIFSSVAEAKTALASHFGYKDGYYTTRIILIKNKKGKVVGRKSERHWVSIDNGIGSPLVNPHSAHKGMSTNNTYCKRVALPAHIICREFGLPPVPKPFGKSYWKKWEVVRKSAVEVTCHKTGKKEICPFGDTGPSKSQVKKGIEIDLTHGLMKSIAGTEGLKKGLIKVTYRILRGYYLRNPYPIGGKVVRLAKN